MGSVRKEGEQASLVLWGSESVQKGNFALSEINEGEAPGEMMDEGKKGGAELFESGFRRRGGKVGGRRLAE